MSNYKNFLSALNHTFWGTLWLVFLKFALQQGQISGADVPYCLKAGVSNLKMAHPYTKIGEEPPLGQNRTIFKEVIAIYMKIKCLRSVLQ